MSEMDEISYWIHTKRAPCLMNYDNPIKRNRPHSSREPGGVTEDAHSPSKKQKRKLSLLDDDSYMEQRQNVYFESRKNPPIVNNHKSDTTGSDVDFDIKNTSVQEKSKKAKLQKSRTLHKKTKVNTPTPQSTAHLRRSLRHNKGVKHHLDSSFEMFNTSITLTNGAHTYNANKSTNKTKAPELLGGGDQTEDNKRNSNNKNKTKTTLNGQFDDMSDVSGFTANYIRSTKVQSNKTPRKIRCKTSRVLVKEPQMDNETNLVITVNKSMNTGGVHNVLNCSTDSSQNLINLVTTKNNDKSVKVDKSTSLLKFLDPKGKDKVVNRKGKSNLNITNQSQSSGTTRYPKRNRTTVTPNVPHATRLADRRRTNNNCVEFNNSDKKENPEDKLVSKTRSGRNIGLQREHSVLVVSNSTDPVSSMVSLNVASPNLAQSSKKGRTPIRQRVKKSTDKMQSPSKRDRSGFAACFSASDDDSEPLIQRKYFCA